MANIATKKIYEPNEDFNIDKELQPQINDLNILPEIPQKVMNAVIRRHVENSKHTEIKKNFENFLTHINKSQNTARDFDYLQFVHCSKDKMGYCLKLFFENYYKNFNKVTTYRDIFGFIFMAIQSTKAEQSFYQITYKIFQTEKSKIHEEKNWNDIVMFGVLFCEFFDHYWDKSMQIRKYFLKWMKRLLYSAINGNENGFIVSLLVVYKMKNNSFLSKNAFAPYYCEVLDVIHKNDDVEVRFEKLNILSKTTNSSVFESIELQEKASYENGVLESAKVQEFMILLECMSEKVNYNLNHFKDMSDDEKVIITQKYIEAVYECNENSKFLAFIGYEFQMVVHKIRSFIKNVMKFIKYNFEDLRNGKYTYRICYKLKNLVVFVGELYVSPYKIVLPIVLTDFLTILIEQNSNLPHGFAFDCVVTSLRLCGFLYKYDDPTNYQKIIDKLKELANNNNYRMQIVREIEDISSELDDFKTDEHEKSPILQEKLNDIYKKRSFKSNESAISYTNLQYFISNLIDHQDVKFDYSDMYFTKSDELYNTAKWLCKTVNENKNVIIVAEFLKSFYTYSCQIADLLSLLKRNLASRISKKFVPDGYNDMLTIGIIIAELQNLKVFDENLGNIWIHKIESFDPTNNDEILKIELRVLSRMMPYANITDGDQSQEIYHILCEIGKVEKIKKLLAERDEKLDATDDKISLSENEKEIIFYKKKISENLPAWDIDARLKQILYFAKTGVHVENIPQMNETTAMIFSNVFFVNCISNQYTIKNYMKALVQLCQNKIFKMYFIRVCQMNFEKLLKSNKFVDTEWDGILMLLVLTFKEKIITEKIVLKILETLKDEKHAEFFSFFINALVKETHVLLVLENPYSEKFKENITQALRDVKIRNRISYKNV